MPDVDDFDFRRDRAEEATWSAADHQPGEVAARVARTDLDRLYAARAFAYRRINEADGHHTNGELRAYDEAGEAIDTWLRQHDAEVRLDAMVAYAKIRNAEELS